jgi:hypothetical protein
MLKNKNGWWLQSHELMPLFGLNAGAHWPQEGFGPTEVQGVLFKCEPASGKGHCSTHRIKYLCVDCKRWVGTGRVAQHRKGREHTANMPQPTVMS